MKIMLDEILYRVEVVGVIGDFCNWKVGWRRVCE